MNETEQDIADVPLTIVAIAMQCPRCSWRNAWPVNFTYQTPEISEIKVYCERCNTILRSYLLVGD